MMDEWVERIVRKQLGRRRFLVLTAGGVAAGAIAAACGDDDNAGSGARMTPSARSSPTANPPAASRQGAVMVGDVLDHALSSDDWPGDFGFVTFRLHRAAVDGEDAYFIRTDASDRSFAETEGLVHVPLLAEAAKNGGQGLGAAYLFANGMADQPTVLNSAPHKGDFSPAFRIHRVSFAGSPSLLNTVDAVLQAEQAGGVTVERTDVVVNYPVVNWPGGELPNDQKREAYLGDGQLLEPVDLAGGKVTFKLHSCYPSLRYIVTDVSLPPMAKGMKIAPAPGAAALSAAGATAKILVFGNGVEGSGPMGFQKSVTDTVLGDAAWSPYWDHFTFTWSDESAAAVLKSEREILSEEEAARLTRFPGTPDTNGELFMVNCPAPVLAAPEA